MTELTRRARAQVPETKAQHPAAVEVLDGREEHRALGGVDLLEVANPFLVGGLRGEVAPQQVRNRIRGPI